MPRVKNKGRTKVLQTGSHQQIIMDPIANEIDAACVDDSVVLELPRAKIKKSRTLGEIPKVRDILLSPVFFGGLKMVQMSVFCRQLAILMEANIPLPRSLSILAQRVGHPELKRVTADLASKLEGGCSLSNALSTHPMVFPPMVIEAVRMGESKGILEQSLRNVAEILEQRTEIHKRLTAAATYPMAAMIACVLSLILILGFAIPIFRRIFESTPAGIADLPGITQYVLIMSNFTKSFWWLIILVLGGAIFAFIKILKGNSGMRHGWDTLMLKMPIIGPLTKQIAIAGFTRTVGNLMAAGIPLIESLRLAADTSANLVVGEAVRNTQKLIEEGGDLELPLRQSKVFPDLAVDVLAVGVEAGRLDEVCNRIAQTYEEDVKIQITSINSVVEPALILLTGIIVLFLALSVLLPYWKISTAVAAGAE